MTYVRTYTQQYVRIHTYILLNIFPGRERGSEKIHMYVARGGWAKLPRVPLYVCTPAYVYYVHIQNSNTLGQTVNSTYVRILPTASSLSSADDQRVNFTTVCIAQLFVCQSNSSPTLINRYRSPWIVHAEVVWYLVRWGKVLHRVSKHSDLFRGGVRWQWTRVMMFA